jgi:Integrase core domain
MPCDPCGRRINSHQVIDVLAEAVIEHGIPDYIRSDNGPEFVAKQLRKWLAKTGSRTLYIEPGSPWENGYCESFNSKMRDEFLNGEIFYSLKEARVLAERWRIYYNTERPHSSLGYKPPAPATVQAAGYCDGQISTPPLRYTNNLTGTNYRADQGLLGCSGLGLLLCSCPNRAPFPQNCGRRALPCRRMFCATLEADEYLFNL